MRVKMPFIDIAFQAEVSRFEDPEFEECARLNCDEEPETRNRAIEELRNMIYQRGECNPRRIDDAYLLRFLRCRRFIPALAHKLMFRYEEFRRKNAYLYHCNAFGLQKVTGVYGGTLPESPTNGRITLMRFGRWDTEAVPVVDVVRCALLMDEIAVMQPKLQILGVTIIVDLEGLSVRHVRHLTPTIANQIVSLMGVSFPLLLHGLHIVRYNWILNTFFYLFKQFIPTAAWERVHFHGHDMPSLHKYISPEYLPPEYGGRCRHLVEVDEWVRKVDRYKDEFMVNELRALGFTVDDEEYNKLHYVNYFFVLFSLKLFLVMFLFFFLIVLFKEKKLCLHSIYFVLILHNYIFTNKYFHYIYNCHYIHIFFDMSFINIF